MNFFEAQARSRSRTSTLILLFFGGVVGLLAAVNLLVLGLLSKGDPKVYLLEHGQDPWTIPAMVTLGTLLVIGCGTVVRLVQLSSGGRGVAKMLGARLVKRETGEEFERRLINVVDEMAIASGMTPPEVYLIDEPSINAMAAGFEPSSAVVIVNRGTLESLSRDELQAVIAHEFSHIFNGDMRLNVRLIGAISGILALVTVGRILTRTRSSSSKNSGGIVFIGMALMLVGGVGALFARLIQAAISRQREFLADATAVQYTRNPEGLIGCFKKILEGTAGSSVSAAAASETSHMFFSSISPGSWLQTHPPLEERIRAIDPRVLAANAKDGSRPRETLRPGVSAAASTSGFAAPAAAPMAAVGRPTSAHLQRAHELQRRFPEVIHAAGHSRRDAEALLLATVAGTSQLASIPAPLRDSAAPLAAEVEKLGVEARFPIVSLALATLRELDEKSKLEVIARLQQLIEADGQYTLFEVAVLTVVERTLLGERSSLLRGGRKAEPTTIEGAIVPLTAILSSVAFAGASTPESRAQRAKAFTNGATKLFGRSIPFIENARGDFRSVLRALKFLDGLDFGSRGKFLEACWHCAATDGVITAAEREMMRAIHCALDCPMPPED